MTKFKKITGIALAGCMALSSLMMTAGAVEVPSEATNDATTLSEFAGTVETGTAVYVDEDGNVHQSMYSVEIPEDATKAEENAIVTNAARTALQIPMTRANTQVDYLGGNDDIDVSAKSGSGTGGDVVWGQRLSRWYNELEFRFTGITGSSSSMNLNLTCDGAGSGQSYSNVCQVNCPISSGRSTIAFVAAKKYNGTYAHFYENDYITALASMNGANASLDVDVYGFYS